MEKYLDAMRGKLHIYSPVFPLNIFYFKYIIYIYAHMCISRCLENLQNLLGTYWLILV